MPGSREVSASSVRVLGTRLTADDPQTMVQRGLPHKQTQERALAEQAGCPASVDDIDAQIRSFFEKGLA